MCCICSSNQRPRYNTSAQKAELIAYCKKSKYFSHIPDTLFELPMLMGQFGKKKTSKQNNPKVEMTEGIVRNVKL